MPRVSKPTEGKAIDFESSGGVKEEAGRGIPVGQSLVGGA
jgi:hypothetical protein